VLREAWHVLVHLQPFPIVARVSTGLASPGAPKPPGVVRELAVASHAARLGAPVMPPAGDLDPGPHWRDGHVVTFWRYVTPSAEVDAAAAGSALRAVHDALADYDGPLPAAGHPEDLDEMLAALEDSRDAEFLRELALRRSDLDGQALHGDAHLGNCLGSSAGPLWHDFETACRGPREYDLAALPSERRFYCDVRCRMRAYRRRRAKRPPNAFPHGALRGRVALAEPTLAELISGIGPALGERVLGTRVRGRG
jgi:hypothetical protein